MVSLTSLALTGSSSWTLPHTSRTKLQTARVRTQQASDHNILTTTPVMPETSPPFPSASFQSNVSANNP